jgi:protein-tyrosine phosphatase
MKSHSVRIAGWIQQLYIFSRIVTMHVFGKTTGIIGEDEMFQILMVCTGNICRSPMAAAMLAHGLPKNLQGKITVSSAGTFALHGHWAAENAIAAMSGLGIDIRSHRARQITSDIVRSADLVLAMERTHLNYLRRLNFFRGKQKNRLLSEFGLNSGEPDIKDPYGGPLEDYLACIRDLQPCINGLINQLRNAEIVKDD